MGCNSGKINRKEKAEIIKNAIDIDNYKAMADLLNQEIKSTKNPELVDQPQLNYDGFTFSVFGYSLYKGQTNCFKCLYKNYKAGVLELINSYHSQGLNPVSVLCSLGNVDLLRYFFPIYLETKEACEFQEVTSLFTPVQVAAKCGHISILNYFNQYFKGKPPYSYDAKGRNIQGENSATLALKEGQYSTLKYIHEKLGVSIDGIKDPIGICLIGASEKKGREYLECAVYIIETLNYSVRKHHLSLLNDNDLFSRYLNTKYLENEITQLPNVSQGSVATNISTEYPSLA
ncbi:hypothetical protein SteCoe_18310 [Stentor coeruleus]|uniref:Uncharacterized protein n=1 Tax=Stentor coeruleus TaxID=5963 RepID=A0A1R2BWV9_9CILI|nr:hypothetical protein SteCoe_18310 [Stentor coeruleus]